MKRLLLAVSLALLLSLALGVSVAGATHSNGKGPNHDFAQGTGQATFLVASRAWFM
jgi:hypothetical protein